MPKIAIVNDNDEIIGSAEMGDARKNGQIHRIVRVLFHDGKGNILLQKRHPKAHDSPSKWDFSAAGHVDEGEDYDTAARRETKEELGLDNIALQPIFKFYAERISGTNRIRRFNEVFLAKVEDHKLVHPDLTELGGVEWFTKSQITEMIRNNPDQFTTGLKERYAQVADHITISGD